MHSSLEVWLAAIAAIGAALQTVLLGVSIIYLNRQFGIVRACSYIERFNSEETIRRRAAVDKWLELSDNEQQKLSEFETDPHLRATILGFMNLFQELGVAYLRHNVHKQTVQSTFDILVPLYWSRVQFLVLRLRATRGASAYVHFEQLAKALSERNDRSKTGLTYEYRVHP